MSFIALMRPDEVVIELGSRLRQHRLRQNMTQAEMARRLEVSVPTISNLENGKGTSLDIFVKAVFALGLQNELQDLFNKPALTIAELQRLAAEPTRQRARAKPKPQPQQKLKPQPAPQPSDSKPTSTEPYSSSAPSRAKLWDKNLFKTNKKGND